MLSAQGHAVSISLTSDAWQAHLEAEGEDLTIRMIDSPDGLHLENGQEAAALDAIDTDDGQALLLALPPQIGCTLRVTLINRPRDSGYHWIRTTAALQELLTTGNWLFFAQALFHEPDHQRLVVADAEGDELHTESIAVHGPGSWPELPAPKTLNTRVEEYRNAWLSDKRAEIPTPSAFLRTRSQPCSDRFLELERLFRAVAHGLTWVWLASAAEIESDKVEIRFDGARQVDADILKPPDHQEADNAVALWRWAVTTSDTLRREAVHRAVSLAVRDREDLHTAAKAVLRTSRYLHDLAQKGEIAEALATRRAARECAIAAARESADATRTATQTTVNRIFAQVIGAFGILIANQGDMIGAATAVWLLVAILVVLVATAAVAYLFELPNAKRTLDAFCSDLDEYRDTLPPDEIKSLKQLESIVAARAQLVRAKILIAVLLVATALACAGVVYFVVTSG